jgi:pilus assembly protein Flp/PilA
MEKLVKLARDENAATAVEYALIVAAIAAIIAVVVFIVGRKTSNSFQKVNSAFNN